MLSLPGISNAYKAKAHGLLVYWYMHTAECRGDPCRRYFYAACHHAEAAVVLCKKVSPPGALPSPVVMQFLSSKFSPQAGDMLEFFYTDLCVIRDKAYNMHNGTGKKREKNIDVPRSTVGLRRIVRVSFNNAQDPATNG
ncbi:hypothetical protein D9619_012204 [Psilocybe cf. subviscida]|uniref:Uncharacterized protein n=1 Tax=Psilocybe cf. subviscida TaxID=2480587 RepID=A0A8H5B998_9AGAR|nr:hypothetical protein D9619_012204 [Psilocybe cf. subviscida]